MTREELENQMAVLIGAACVIVAVGLCIFLPSFEIAL